MNDMLTLEKNYDKLGDTLYVRYNGVFYKYSRECEYDYNVVFDFDDSNFICGIRVILASEFEDEEWARHPARKNIPKDMLNILDDTLVEIHKNKQ